MEFQKDKPFGGSWRSSEKRKLKKRKLKSKAFNRYMVTNGKKIGIKIRPAMVIKT